MSLFFSTALMHLTKGANYPKVKDTFIK
jgi:hypothetical protein